MVNENHAEKRRVEAARLRRIEGGAGAARELDPLIHDRVRLSILAALAAGGPLGFVELKEASGATDGNLASHGTKLEAAGYVRISKDRGARRTTYGITKKGARALHRYVEHMRRIIDAVE